MSTESLVENSDMQETVEDLGNQMKRFELDLAVIRREMKTEGEQTQQRVRRVMKELGEEKDALDAVRVRLREEVARLEVDTGGSVRLSKEILHLFEESEKTKKAEIEEIRETVLKGSLSTSELAAAFSSDSSHHKATFSALSAQQQDLKAQFNSQFSAHLLTIQSLVKTSEVKTQSAITQLNGKFQQWTETHQTENSCQMANLGKNLEQTRREVGEVKDNLEERVKDLGNRLKANIGEVEARLRKAGDKIKESIGKGLKEVEDFLLKMKETEKQMALEHTQTRDYIAQMQRNFDSLLSTHKAEFTAISLKLEDLIVSKEQQIQHIIFSENANLVEKLTHDCAARLEEGVSGLRAKLAV